MSAEEQPRSKQVLIAVVEHLRADDTLAGWLYEDEAIPAPEDRKRIHEKDIAKTFRPPAHIIVSAAGSGGTYRGGQMSHSYAVQLSIRVTDDYYERWTSTRLHDINDRCSALLESSAPARGIMPGGPTGSGDPHEARAGTNDRVLVSRFRFSVHWTTRWPD